MPNVMGKKYAYALANKKTKKAAKSLLTSAQKKLPPDLLG